MAAAASSGLSTIVAAVINIKPVILAAFSNAILEKMAMGLPLVVTDVGGNAEAVLDGYNGIVIPPYDSSKLADAIIYLYSHREKRKEMGCCSRKRIEQKFSLEKMIKNYEEYYSAVMRDV